MTDGMATGERTAWLRKLAVGRGIALALAVTLGLLILNIAGVSPLPHWSGARVLAGVAMLWPVPYFTLTAVLGESRALWEAQGLFGRRRRVLWTVLLLSVALLVTAIVGACNEGFKLEVNDGGYLR